MTKSFQPQLEILEDRDCPAAAIGGGHLPPPQPIIKQIGLFHLPPPNLSEGALAAAATRVVNVAAWFKIDLVKATDRFIEMESIFLPVVNELAPKYLPGAEQFAANGLEVLAVAEALSGSPTSRE